jgi:nitrate/nitrite transport system substrate-binding protein
MLGRIAANRTRRTVLCLGAAVLLAGATAAVVAKPLKLEKEQIKLGFIKLTDMAPLAVAYEKGYFEDEGLYVTLEAQSNWKVVLDRVIGGELDGSHMLAGQPLGATLGIGTKADLITSYSMDINGKAITVSNEVWALMAPRLPKGADGKAVHPIKADYLQPALEQFRSAGKALKLGIVFPVSGHNYDLRYWLAAGGVNPGVYTPTDLSGQVGADVLLSVTPPPQMPATMEAGTISGYCVGEPWNQQAIFKKVGVPIVLDNDLFTTVPDKVFGVRKDWAGKYPNTHLAVLKALIRAGIWLDADNGANRKEAAQILSRSEYVGADARVIEASMTGTFEFGKGDKRPAPDFNIFFRGFASYPFQSDAVWTLTQMRRWGQIAEARPDSWYAEIAKSVNRADLYMQAAQLLIVEGKATRNDFPFDGDGYRAPAKAPIDGIEFDGRKPNEYIDKFRIGLKGTQKAGG